MKAFFAILLASQTAFCADFLTGQAARVVIGQQNFTALLTPAVASPQTALPGILGGASGVAYANNHLFVADGNKTGAFPVNNRVLIYTPVSEFPTPAKVPTPQQNEYFSLTCPICVGNPALALGQAGFTTTDQALTQNGLRNPTAVASDGTVLVVADTDNNRVLIWNSIPSSSAQNADVVIGQPDFTHGASVATPKATTLRGPQGVWVAGGKLFIADTLDNRVLIYNSIPKSNNAAADLVLGQSDFGTLVTPPVTDQVVPATQTNLASPTSVTTDGSRLYVADLGHNRVLIWNTIPTSNNAGPDIVLGQKDFVGQTANDSSNLCPSNGTNTTVTPNVPTYPFLCGTTLSFPRFVLSDGQRLFVADSGNDRVLVFNTIPTSNDAKPDVILGQLDENTDASSPGSDALATPSALAWDGANLYIADTFNLRVVVYTPLGNRVPLTGVRNAASLEIFATARVAFTGTPTAKDTVTVTIGTTNYTYTVQTNDTLANVAAGLWAQINGSSSGSTPDPNVIATEDLANPAIFLTARKPGDAGTGTALTATVSSTSSIVPAASASTVNINLATAVKIAPGALITIYGTDLTTETAAFDYGSPYLPRTLAGATVYIDGLQAPLLYVSPTQINAQMPYEMANRGSVSVYVVNSSGAAPVATNAIGTTIVSENPGLFAGYGADPRPGIVNHLSANAIGLISVDGTITAGNTATITIANATLSPAVSNTYTYTLQASDTLDSIRNALVAQLQSDPLVTVSATNTFTRIILVSRVAGAAGNSVTYTAATNSGGTLTLTAFQANLCCGNSAGGPVTSDNPARPGETLYTYATGLGETNPPTDSNTGQLTGQSVNPLSTPVDSILAGGSTANLVQSSLVPGTVGLYQVVFQLPTSLATDPLTQLTIAQQFYVSNIVTFPVVKP